MAEKELTIGGHVFEVEGEYTHGHFSQNRVKPRLTVVENLYHQLPGEQPTQSSASFNQQLESDEDAQLRRYKATEEWQQIPFEPSFESLACVKVENREGMRLAVQPDLDERERIASRVLEIAFTHPGALSPTHENRILIPPGTSCRFALQSAKGVLIRSRSGVASYFLTAIPG